MTKAVAIIKAGFIYPCTIVPARYSGSYEGGSWLAFALQPDRLPPQWNGDDLSCSAFFQTFIGPLGRGKSPEEALKNLHKYFETHYSNQNRVEFLIPGDQSI